MPSLVAGEPLRVLLISPHSSLRTEVGEALAGVGDHRYYWISQPDLALARSEGLAPHVMLLDDDLDGQSVTALVRQLVQGVGGSALVVLISDGPQALTMARDTVLAGARGFLPKPVQGDALYSTLRQVLAHGPLTLEPEYSPSSGWVVTFCGPKGGTGRTTLAINTAVTLREVTKAGVVLVDADYAAPAIDVALNLRGQRDIRDLIPKLNTLDQDLINSVLARHTSGVRALLAPPPEDLHKPPSLPQVQQVVSWLKRMFPWVLVDLGLPLDEAAYAFMDASDRVVMSILPEMVGMRNAKLMLAQLKNRGYPPDKVWPLLNRDGLPGGIRSNEVERYLMQELRFLVPNDQQLATETINRGVPMVISHRRRPLAQAYRALSRELDTDRRETEKRRAAALAAAETGVELAAPVPVAVPPDNGPGATLRSLFSARQAAHTPAATQPVAGRQPAPSRRIGPGAPPPRPATPALATTSAATAPARAPARAPVRAPAPRAQAPRRSPAPAPRYAGVRPQARKPSRLERVRRALLAEPSRRVFATVGIVVIVLAILLSLVLPWMLLRAFGDAGGPVGMPARPGLTLAVERPWPGDA